MPRVHSTVARALLSRARIVTGRAAKGATNERPLLRINFFFLKGVAPESGFHTNLTTHHSCSCFRKNKAAHRASGPSSAQRCIAPHSGRFLVHSPSRC